MVHVPALPKGVGPEAAQRIIRQCDRVFGTHQPAREPRQILVASVEDVQANVARLGAEFTGAAAPTIRLVPASAIVDGTNSVLAIPLSQVQPNQASDASSTLEQAA